MNKPFSSLLTSFLILVLALGSGSCRTDALAPDVSEEVRHIAATDSVVLQLELGNVGFDTRIPVNTPEDVQQEQAARHTRSALTVNTDGTTTLNLTQGGTKELEVLLILRNADGSKVYVSAGNKWRINSDNKTVAATGIYSFTAVKGASGSPSWREDEVWYLDAMTGGTWDNNTKAYLINKECKVPNKLYKVGESLEIGKDIIVPFSLGTSSVGTSDANRLTHDRKWGVRMAVVNHNRNSGGTVYRLVCIDSNPDFRPYGSLLCMRFKNDMHKIKDNPAFATDGMYSKYTWKTPLLSYLLRAISIESSSATTGGWIQTSSLGQPDRMPLTWHGFRPDGTAYRFDNTYDNPFFQKIKLDKTVDNDLHTGYPLFRKNENESDSKWTPYFYVWMKSLDESKNSPLYGSSLGLNVRLELYNASTDNKKVDGARSVITSLRIHKSGHAYFSEKTLGGELMMSSLGYLGPDYVYKTPQGVEQWAQPGYQNEQMINSRYTYNQLQDRINGRDGEYPFPVAKPAYNDEGSPTNTNLRWLIPDELSLASVFPPQMANINHGSRLWNNKFEGRTERVRLGGVIYDKMKSYYFRSAAYTWEQSTNANNYNVFYGLRYVGTDHCEAVRYIQYDEWVYNGPQGNRHRSNNSRFIVQTRHLGKIGLDPDNSQAAYNFLKNVVAAGDPRPQGTPPHNAFWGEDFEHPDASRGITTRSFHVPGSTVNQGNFGTSNQNEAQRVGRAMTIATIIPPGERNAGDFSYYIVVGGGEGQSYEFVRPFTSIAGFSNKRTVQLSIIPMLAPAYFPDPTWVDDIRRQP